MTEDQSGPVELGAPMDYREHEKTYGLFLAGAKYGSIIIAALLISMAAGFFGHVGWVASFLLFPILSALGILMAR